MRGWGVHWGQCFAVQGATLLSPPCRLLKTVQKPYALLCFAVHSPSPHHASYGIITRHPHHDATRQAALLPQQHAWELLV